MKRTGKCLLAFIFIFISFSSCTLTKDRLVSTPLEGVKPEMEDERYWTQKIDSPSEDVMTREEIAQRNHDILKKDDVYMYDLLNFPDSLQREEIVEMLEICNSVLKKPRYNHLNHPISEGEKLEILKSVNQDGIPPVKSLQWAVTLIECNMRALPTNEMAMEETCDFEFDHFQFSRINPGEAVAVMHHSLDGQWSFVASYFSLGWIENQHIALARNKDAVLDFIEGRPFVIYTGNSGYLFYDQALTRPAIKIRMGTRFPLSEETDKRLCVLMPVRDRDGYFSLTQGYLAKDPDAHIGYLPLTQENVANLAFKLKGSLYGWGGMFDGRDCSRLIFDIFKCLGMILPRNSGSQAKVGASSIDLAHLSEPEKESLVMEKGVPFATFLNLPGHIMLYIGKDQDRAYVIQSLWAYREGILFKDRLRKVGRVVVSDLYLGEGSKKGSLLERLSSMTLLVDR